MVNFEEIEEIFKRLEGRLKPEEFTSKVETKFTEMNGLCDSRTAAMFIAFEESEEIQEIFKKLEGKLTLDEFKVEFEKKFLEMNGLCDLKTSALLVANKFDLNQKVKKGGPEMVSWNLHPIEREPELAEMVKIRDMTADKGNVVFIAKVTSVGDIKEFSRDNDTMGRVVNLNLADETGSIRAALWDDAADLVKIGDIKMGQAIKVKGFIKQGQRGLEVNVGRGGNVEHVEIEVPVKVKAHKISEIKAGMNDLNILGKVLDIGKVRTFARKDGKTGKVANITIGDETGKIRVTLWDAKAQSSGVNAGDIVEVMNAYARENTFSNSTELSLGSGGGIARSSAVVTYNEPLTPISDIGINAAYSVAGNVSGIDEIREFDRPDGTKSRVSNIYISDNTGRIKVALWAEHADLVNKLEIGSDIRIVDAFAKSGRNEEVELSAGTRTSIQVIRK